MDKPIYRCMTKATTAEGKDLRRSFNWVVARRAVLRVMPDALLCGDWLIGYDRIDEAVLFSIRTIIPGYLLRVRSGETVYQFGLNWNPFWKKELPFPVSREIGKMKYSLFSFIARAVLFGYFAYLILGYMSN